MPEPLRVLFVEDSSDDFDLEQRALKASGLDVSAMRVQTAEGMRAALDEARWDLVIADYSMPRFNAVAALELLKGKALDIPFIIVSGTIHEDTAVAAMRGGARDYLMKNNLARLGPAVGRELREAASREARRKAERLALAGLQDGIRRLIEGYRERGHLRARVDPLGLALHEDADLSLASFGLGEEHLDMVFATGDVAGPPSATLREIIARLEATYCRTIGVEFTHVENLKMRTWLQERMESSCNHMTLGRDAQLRLLSKLTDAEMFERFLHVKYVGAKRFSLEGAESLIPLLDCIIENAADHAADELVMAMAHRGRLNVLANVLGKDLRSIFGEFEDRPTEDQAPGDVKYHLGHSADCVTSRDRAIRLSLCFNPSHLEWIDPVALGRVRAKLDRRTGAGSGRVLPLIIHGDASFAGQGLVAETLNLSGLPGYSVGGAIHIVLNNQIGFTTSPDEARSTRYATDVCRMLRVPIFHVNGEDPEAVAWVASLAVEFRQQFGKDAIIDLYCYRKHGHNEGDEPSFSHPSMYKVIESKPSIRELYTDHIVAMGHVTRDDAARIEAQRRDALEHALEETRAGDHTVEPSRTEALWADYRGGPDADCPEVPTHVPEARLRTLLERLVQTREGFHAHHILERGLLANRREMAAGNRPVDWSAAEALAFASLLVDGVRVRLTGQDSRRGTFSQRHAALVDIESGQMLVPLDRLSPDQARFEVWNSPLSEAAVLGFEYGYSLDAPDTLVAWEAQFGDFVNAAQVITDQFLSTGEIKWQRLSGLVMMLPHGFEGQGPEHSSARIERFLGLCANDNLQVCSPTTPAQLFHLLRRQMVRPYRKPLVMVAPKSLLRHKAVTSTLQEFGEGRFRRVLADTSVVDTTQVRRVMLCSGKIFYELQQARVERKLHDVAIIRLEQLYPLATADLTRALEPFGNARRLWVQEEPRNMGAYPFLSLTVPALGLECVARAENASPGAGSTARHRREQAALIDRAFS